MMRILHKNNIECPLPVLSVHGAEKSLEKLGDGTSIISVLRPVHTRQHSNKLLPETTTLLPKTATNC